MKKLSVATIILIAVAVSLSLIFSVERAMRKGEGDTKRMRTEMILTSPAFKNNEFIPRKYTCDGGDINPELHVQNVPDKAGSLVLIMDDPDAPGGTFVHWLVFNVDPKTAIIKEESVPPRSTEGMTSFGKVGYGGPCPPQGKPHRYFFKLYALDVSRLPEFETLPDKAELEAAMEGHIIESAELVGLYKR